MKTFVRVLVAVSLWFWQLASPPRAQQRTSSPSVAAASTAEDYDRLAAHHRCKVQLLVRKAQDYTGEADAYASDRLFEPKTGIPGGLLAHCPQFSAYYWQQARRAEEMAESEEKLVSQSRQQ